MSRKTSAQASSRIPISNSAESIKRRLFTCSFTSCGVNPTDRKKSQMTAAISASACGLSTPSRSRFHWKNSRVRPFCGRSYLQNGPKDHQRTGKVSWPTRFEIILASEGVNSGRRVISSPPRSWNTNACSLTSSSPDLAAYKSSVSR